MSVGALVRIQGEARMGVTELKQASPFMRGVMVALTDAPVGGAGATAAAATALELEGVMKVSRSGLCRPTTLHACGLLSAGIAALHRRNPTGRPEPCHEVWRD